MTDQDENTTQDQEQPTTEPVIDVPPTTEYVEKSDKTNHETREGK